MVSAAVLTNVVPVHATGPGCLEGTYKYLFPNPHATAGNPLDFTTDFDFVFGCEVISNDTAADNGYHFGFVVPAPTVACTSSNVLITLHQEKDPAASSGVDLPFPAVGNVDMSAIGQCMIHVYGA